MGLLACTPAASGVVVVVVVASCVAPLWRQQRWWFDQSCALEQRKQCWLFDITVVGATNVRRVSYRRYDHLAGLIISEFLCVESIIVQHKIKQWLLCSVCVFGRTAMSSSKLGQFVPQSSSVCVETNEKVNWRKCCIKRFRELTRWSSSVSPTVGVSRRRWMVLRVYVHLFVC